MAFMNKWGDWGDCACRISRYLLLVGIAVVAALILTAPPQQRLAANPLRMNSANAAGGVCSAPNYLALTTVGGTDKFYIIDTNKKVICVYRIQTAAIRLTAARKFDEDEKIWDGSLPLLNGKPLEGGDGITRDQAKRYADDMIKLIEQGKKKP